MTNNIDEKIDKAWDYFLEDKLTEAKELVLDTFESTDCTHYRLLNLMGYIYLKESDYQNSKIVFEKYIKTAQQDHDFENEHIGFHQLAMVYRELKNYTKALELIEKENLIIEKKFKTDNLKKSVNNYEQGYLRLKMNKLEEALYYMNKCLKQAAQTNDITALACAHRGLGEIYSAQAKPVKAKNHFKKAIKLFMQAEDTIGADEVQKLINRIG